MSFMKERSSLNRHNIIVHEGKKPKVSVVPDIVRLYTQLEESDKSGGVFFM